MDFLGVIEINSLEIGSIEMDAQPIPAVRFLLKQNKPYLILASGHLAEEIYAYCVAAFEKGIKGIDVKIACVLIMDIKGSLHAAVSSIGWYTSRNLREHVAISILDVFERGTKSNFKTCDTPFIVVEKSGK